MSAAIRIGSGPQSPLDAAMATAPTSLDDRESLGVLSARTTALSVLSRPDDLLLMSLAASAPLAPELVLAAKSMSAPPVVLSRRSASGNSLPPSSGPVSVTALRMAAMRQLSGIPMRHVVAASSGHVAASAGVRGSPSAAIQLPYPITNAPSPSSSASARDTGRRCASPLTAVTSSPKRPDTDANGTGFECSGGSTLGGDGTRFNRVASTTNAPPSPESTGSKVPTIHGPTAIARYTVGNESGTATTAASGAGPPTSPPPVVIVSREWLFMAKSAADSDSTQLTATACMLRIDRGMRVRSRCDRSAQCMSVSRDAVPPPRVGHSHVPHVNGDGGSECNRERRDRCIGYGSNRFVHRSSAMPAYCRLWW
ncbi:hypothetical protein BC828DRAFT_435761 [Blastocladiella britannica]|nr:hypothetical protein BC828DRAFT_435761 [Blastocladiella britannica]